MAAPTETLVENAQRTQEALADAVTEAVRTWTDALQGLTSGRFSLPDAEAIVDRWFDVVQTMLDTQKAFALSVVSASVHAAEVYTEQAREAAGSMTRQAENVMRPAINAARVTDEPSPPAVLAPRNGASND